jgi:hypothetical protein
MGDHAHTRPKRRRITPATWQITYESGKRSGIQNGSSQQTKFVGNKSKAQAAALTTLA